MIGNSGATSLIERIVQSGNLGHAYLFSGPEGVGKKLAALRFCRLINCRCDGNSLCESCQMMETLSHPELLIFEDANEPRWFRRDRLMGVLADSGVKDEQTYRATVDSLIERALLEAPYPAVDRPLAIDGFRIATNLIFGRGSVPSNECYTPLQFSEALRRQIESGEISPSEHSLLRMLYEYPISVMPYRGAIPIAYVTGRQGWKFVRPLQKFLSMRTISGGRKVVIIDDAHKMTPEAQNCLLKTLEEPPADSLLILITSQKELLFETILSRCQVIDFKRLTAGEMVQFSKIVGGDSTEANLLLPLAEGSPRKLLDLLAGDIGSKLEAIGSLFDSIIAGRVVAIFDHARKILDGAGTHRKRQQEAVGQILELTVFYLVQILRLKKGKGLVGLSPQLVQRLSEQAKFVEESRVHQALSFIGTRYDIVRRNVDMATLLQSTMLRIAILLGRGGLVDRHAT